MSLPTHLSGMILAALSASCFALQIPFIKLASQKGIDPSFIIAFRAYLLAAAVAIWFKIKSNSFYIESQYRRGLFIFGLFTALVSIAYLSSVKFLPVALATLTFYTYPLWILLGDQILNKQKPSTSNFIIFAIVFCGLMLAIGSSIDNLSLLGLSIALFASIFAAGQFLSAQSFNTHIPALQKILWIHIIIAPISTLAWAFTEANSALLSNLWQAKEIVLLTILCYTAALCLQFLAFKKIKPSLMGLVFCIEPIISMSVASLLLREFLTPLQFIGSSIVCAGIIYIAWSENKKASQKAGL